MKYQIENLTEAHRRFWVKKSPKIFYLEPKEKLIIEYEPFPNKHFNITIIEEQQQDTEKSKFNGATPRKKRNKKRKKLDNGKR